MKEVKDYLLSKQDLNYLVLNKKLNIGNNQNCIGVRLPIIRSYAKTLLKKYSPYYLISNIDEDYYEEILLKGQIIGNSKNLSYGELINYIEYFLPKITDWSICDSFCLSLKITLKYRDELWEFLIKQLDTNKEFYIRFTLVMILNYYIDATYKKRIYNVIKEVKNEEYYVKMANAWLISYMFINYFEDTISFVQKNKLNKWTINKGITKAIESLKLSREQKNILRDLRNKLKEI